MIDRRTISDDDHESRRIAAIRALGLSWAGFGIEDTARVDRWCHRNRDFPVRNFNLASDAHDSITFGSLFRKVCELHEIAGQLRIADKCGAGLSRDFDCVANMIAMPVSKQYVIDFRKRSQRISLVLNVRIRWVTEPGID